MLNDGLESCELLQFFYQLFELSFWWHQFTEEDPLVSKWCNAKCLQIVSNEATNSSTSWMAWEWGNIQQITFFTISLKFKFNLCAYNMCEVMSVLFWYKACATSKRDMQPIWILQLDKYIQFPIARFSFCICLHLISRTSKNKKQINVIFLCASWKTFLLGNKGGIYQLNCGKGLLRHWQLRKYKPLNYPAVQDDC